MMQHMPELLLVPAIIGIVYLIYVRMQYDCEITILQKELKYIKNNNKLIMDSHTANALSTETNTKKFNEKYGTLLNKINMYMQVAIEQGNYECHVPVAKEDNKPKEIISYLEGKRYIVNYIELPSDKLYNNLRIYWGDH
jgi:hypothetical protein